MFHLNSNERTPRAIKTMRAKPASQRRISCQYLYIRSATQIIKHRQSIIGKKNIIIISSSDSRTENKSKVLKGRIRTPVVLSKHSVARVS
jgi:hypothetical protein